MATLDRIEAGWVPWTPSASGIGVLADDYAGKHRLGGTRFFSVRRLFYSARHRRR